jgi:hypothetical protein
MLKRYTFWFWAAIVFMFLTGAIHSIGLFISPAPANETERQLIDLMHTYRRDLGAGFHPSTQNLFTALSSCFTFLCLLGGLTNAYLLRKKAAADLLKGIVRINLLIFGACFIVMAALTFLPPVVLTGIIAALLLVTLLTIS